MNKTKRNNIIVMLVLLGIVVSVVVAIQLKKYNEKKETYLYALELLDSKHYEEARKIFSSLEGFKDCKTLQKECIYRTIIDHFDKEEYQDIVNLNESYDYLYNISNYKDTCDIVNESYNKLEAQKAEEKYKKLIDVRQNMYGSSISSLKSLQRDIPKLIDRGYDKVELEKIDTEIDDYIQLAKKVYNEYCDIAYAHALDMTTSQVENYAQNKLSQKYNITKYHAKAMFESYMSYVKQGG